MVFTSFLTFSQDNLYTSLTIDPALKKNANAVIRNNVIDITIKSLTQMVVREKRVITIINKQGNKNVNAYLYYDKGVNIKTLQALVFDAFGNEIKKIKKSNFKDVSAVDGGTLYSDSRVKYLEYTPINYPYTVEFTYETISSNTAFIKSFQPVSEYYVSTEKSSYHLNNLTQAKIRNKEKHLDGFNVVKKTDNNKINYKIESLKALKPEDFSPSLSDIIPKVMFALSEFNLEGVSARVENWNDFGKWMYNDLIKGTQDLPQTTINVINELIKEETDDIAKAKIIYQYVQDKVRYISVQVGIGGWKPFNASYVDRLSYGDCKALTNYTMSLMKAADIETNYAVVYAGKSQKNIEKDFASMQGNHVILSIPSNEDTVWLECTSQKTPFGFIGDFTDDRDVFVVTPDGGEIKHTKKYTTNESLQTVKGACKINMDGSINVNSTTTSKGIQYDDKYGLATQTQRDLDEQYKERWDYVNNINFSKIKTENDRENIEFIESIDFSATNYGSIISNRMLFNINVLNRYSNIPDRYRNRTLPLKIKRGFMDIDEVEISLPVGYSVEALPENKTIENKFGSYITSLIVKNETTLVYNREFIVNDGDFPKEDYAAFRTFYKNVAKSDNAKISLIKN